MCRQGVFVENPHSLPQFPTFEGDLTPNHPQYRQIATQRRQIRKWKMRNQRVDEVKKNKNQGNNDAANKKELRRIKNRESAALSRKRKLEEVEEARQTIETLNQENVILRQRLLELEQTVKSLKCHENVTVHQSHTTMIKSEPMSYSQPQLSVPSNHYQLPYSFKQYQQFPAQNVLPEAKNFQLGYPETIISFEDDELDPFGFDSLNQEDFHDFLASPRFEFTNW